LPKPRVLRTGNGVFGQGENHLSQRLFAVVPITFFVGAIIFVFALAAGAAAVAFQNFIVDMAFADVNFALKFDRNIQLDPLTDGKLAHGAGFSGAMGPFAHLTAAATYFNVSDFSVGAYRHRDGYVDFLMDFGRSFAFVNEPFMPPNFV
jgi:hypothetical protein